MNDPRLRSPGYQPEYDYFCLVNIYLSVNYSNTLMMYPWGNIRRFNAWSDRAREKFGSRLQKLSINAGLSCPNRDGTVSRGGCTFCNNDGFNPSYCDPAKSIHQQIDEGLTFIKKRYARAKLFVAYFQAFSNTHAPLLHLRSIYGEALQHPAITGLVIGTRPDCIDDEKLDYLQALSEQHFIKIEYGVESCYNETLLRINRGHTFEASVQAIKATAARGIFNGIHLILGLPGESRQMMLDQVNIINKLPVNTIKFHQLQIVKNTLMAKEYADCPERFDLFELDEYIDLVISFIERLRPDISIDRFSGEVPPRLIAGKRWENIRSDGVIGLIEEELEKRNIYQGMLFTPDT